MTTALYIVSPHDNVEVFSSSARSVEYDDKKVYVGKAAQAVQPVVFSDGAPIELKNKLSDGKLWDAEWLALKKRAVALLAMLHLECDDVRILVHFGGQGEDEVGRFNKVLASLTADEGACRCYAISFGNKMPRGLFVDGKFSPPTGERFFAMCRELQYGTAEDFPVLRALRVLLSCTKPDETGMYDVGASCRQLLSATGHKAISDALSAAEREFVVTNPLLCKVFKGSRSGNAINIPDRIDEQEFMLLLKNLEMEEPKQ